ncbi:PhzF family phenazine biosynthesis protein [Erythrobacter sp. HA6-11]
MKTFIVDAFTQELFKGNQAGVCLIDEGFDTDNFPHIARELGFSETGFLQKTSDPTRWLIRFFSPVMEIPLCGHATIAAAAVLFEELDETCLTFINNNDLHIPVSRSDDEIWIEFPNYPTVPATVPQSLLNALGLSSTLNSRFNQETKILMLEIEDVGVLGSLKPDFAALTASHKSINGVLVTAASIDDHYDYHCRYFWPWSGTNEDPATGGVQTFLAPYWAEKLGKRVLKAYQSSERTGAMDVEVFDNLVLLKSNARIVLSGEMRI